MMTWKDVFKVHRKIGAVYFEEKKLKSVLFSLDKRRNRHNYKIGNVYYLCFNNDGKSSEVSLILSLLKVGDIFTVYEKVSPDCWKHAGLNACTSIKEGNDPVNRKSIIVTVEPVK